MTSEECFAFLKISKEIISWGTYFLLTLQCMRLDKAIKKYLPLAVAQAKIDERAFFNVLMDFHAFDEANSLKLITASFIEHGFLKKMIARHKDWKLKAIYYLTEQLGFEEKQVVKTVNYFEAGFAHFDISKFTSTKIDKKRSDTDDFNIHHNFQEIDFSEIEVLTHPSKPLDFPLNKGDIVIAQYGVAQIESVEEDFLVVRYIKRRLSSQRRKVYYDEKLEFVISPFAESFYFSSQTNRYFFVKNVEVDRDKVRIYGTYSDKLCVVTFIPYTFLQQSFSLCKESDFMSHCVDQSLFNRYKKA